MKIDNFKKMMCIQNIVQEYGVRRVKDSETRKLMLNSRELVVDGIDLFIALSMVYSMNSLLNSIKQACNSFAFLLYLSSVI